MEDEILDGFTSIRKRELTDEEANTPITSDRIRSYEIEIGESFIDQHGSGLNRQAIMGFMMARHPDKATELLEMGNSQYLDLNALDDIFMPEGWKEEEYSKMLQDVCDFINLTVATKRRINTILICVDEHYNKK